MFHILSALLKRVLPRRVARYAANLKRQREYGGLATQDKFEKVYADGFWGKDQEGNPLSGSGSHDSNIVEPYVGAVRGFLERLDSPTVVDLGCGDFNVGRQLTASASTYLACDISETILAVNRNRFHIPNVTFVRLDLSRDVLPTADVCIVRQVLQHLSNAEITMFVNQIMKTAPYRYLLVTEHVAENYNESPNIDKPSGPGVRVELRSGVDLGAPPFNLQFQDSQTLLSVAQDSGGIPARIVTTAYRLL